MDINKRIGLLTAIAVIFVAFAVPATAAASGWKDKGVEVAATKIIPFTAVDTFTGALGGVTSCQVHGEFHIRPFLIDRIINVVTTTSTCKGTGGLSGCTITSVTAEGQPWDIDNKGTHLAVTGRKVTYKFSGFLCPSSITVSGNGATLTPDNSKEISSFNLGGELEASVGGNVTPTGTVQLSNSSDVKTYGL